MTLILPDRFQQLTPTQIDNILCRADAGVFAERRRNFHNSAVHWEWYEQRRIRRRLALIAPRDHAKSEVFTITGTLHDSLYIPGTWTYVFSATKDLAEEMKARIESAMLEVDGAMVRRARSNTKSDITFQNYSRVTVAGVGKKVRGAHPDVIVGDDVLEEKGCRSSAQRRFMESWWHGTVGGMATTGKYRSLGGKERVKMPPTRIFLVGTPFHQDDLLSKMRSNPIYHFRRYSAEFDPGDLVDGLALEAS